MGYLVAKNTMPSVVFMSAKYGFLEPQFSWRFLQRDASAANPTLYATRRQGFGWVAGHPARKR